MDKIIGKLIEERVKTSKMSVAEFGRQINKERSNVYDIFKRSSIDTELLDLIGQVLKYDFFQHFLQQETVEKIRLSENIQKSKVLIEIELSDEEIENLNITEKVFKQIYKLNPLKMVAESKINYQVKKDSK